MLNLKGWGLLLVFFTQSLGGAVYNRTQNCFSSVDVKIPISYNKFGRERVTGISQDEFTTVLDEVEKIYTPIFASLGKRFKIERRWSDPTANAYAQQLGDTWKVVMFGGLARHKLMNIDAFRSVVCHEIGHHLGGAPKAVSRWYGTESDLSSEGQSDYYATSKCMKRLILEGPDAGLAVESTDESIFEIEEVEAADLECSKRYLPGDGSGNSKLYDVCKRSALVALSMGRVLRALRLEISPYTQIDAVSLSTPDENEVRETEQKVHPMPQCRTDTYFAGAVCDVDYNVKMDNVEERIGTCNRSEGFDYGLRPRCWYKPS